MAFCTKCGAQVPDGTSFCTACGAPLASAAAAPAPAAAAPAPAPQPQPQPAPQPQYQQQTPQYQQQTPQYQQQTPQYQQQAPQYQQAPPPQYQQQAPQYQQQAAQQSAPQPQPAPQQQAAPQPAPAPKFVGPSPFDHTAEFGKDDVKKFKFIAAALYLVVAGMFFVTNDGVGIVTMFQNLLKSATFLIFGGAAVGTTAFLAMGTGMLLLCMTAALAPSEYLRFHATQAAKLMLWVLLLAFVSIIPIIGPVTSYIGIWATTVFGVIGFIQAIKGKSVESILTRFIK